MKILYILMILSTILFTSCGNENPVPDEESAHAGHSPSETYNWEGYDTGAYFGEIVFVPVYSSVFHQNGRTYELTATLTVHNTDLTAPLKILKTDYYNTRGRLIKKFTNGAIDLDPLQSKQFIIEELDVTGGTAPKFIVQWVSDTKISKPVIEAVMISTSSQQGISFKTESTTISSIGYQD